MKKNDNIITLSGENGGKLDFYIEAELEYEGYGYVILRPVDSSLGISQDEAIIFRIEDDEFYVEENMDIISEIERIYNSEL